MSKFNDADAIGIPVRITREVIVGDIKVDDGTVGQLKWVGPDKFNPQRQRCGVQIGGHAKLVYVDSSDLERTSTYSDTPPFKAGDRVALRKYADDPRFNGTVFNVSRVTETQWASRGGKVGVRYGRPTIVAEVGDWRLGVEWDSHPPKTRIHRWVYVRGGHGQAASIIAAKKEQQ